MTLRCANCGIADEIGGQDVDFYWSDEPTHEDESACLRAAQRLLELSRPFVSLLANEAGATHNLAEIERDASALLAQFPKEPT